MVRTLFSKDMFCSVADLGVYHGIYCLADSRPAFAIYLYDAIACPVYSGLQNLLSGSIGR